MSTDYSKVTTQAYKDQTFFYTTDFLFPSASKVKRIEEIIPDNSDFLMNPNKAKSISNFILFFTAIFWIAIASITMGGLTAGLGGGHFHYSLLSIKIGGAVAGVGVLSLVLSILAVKKATEIWNQDMNCAIRHGIAKHEHCERIGLEAARKRWESTKRVKQGQQKNASPRVESDTVVVDIAAHLGALVYAAISTTGSTVATKVPLF